MSRRIFTNSPGGDEGGTPAPSTPPLAPQAAPVANAPTATTPASHAHASQPVNPADVKNGITLAAAATEFG